MLVSRVPICGLSDSNSGFIHKFVPLIPSLPLSPLTHIGLVVMALPSVYVITDLVQIYLPLSHPGYVVLHDPPERAVAEVDL